MIRVNLTDNFSTLDRVLIVLERDHMPFAIARALTDMAQLGKATIAREIPAIFSKGGPPKPFTVNSAVARPASKSTLAAEVFIKNTQAAYLQLEETGGTRSPRGAALVWPGSSAPALHDSHGNLPEGLLRRLRAAARTTRANAKRARRASRKVGAGGAGAIDLPGKPQRDAGIVYFEGHGPHGRGTGGYYERLADGHLRRLTGFEPTGTYRATFAYHARLAAVIVPAFAPALMRRLQEAIASGR